VAPSCRGDFRETGRVTEEHRLIVDRQPLVQGFRSRPFRASSERKRAPQSRQARRTSCRSPASRIAPPQGDPRIIRLVQKWLRAGVLEDGIVTIEEKGTGQGSVISPCSRTSTSTTSSISGPSAGDGARRQVLRLCHTPVQGHSSKKVDANSLAQGLSPLQIMARSIDGASCFGASTEVLWNGRPSCRRCSFAGVQLQELNH